MKVPALALSLAVGATLTGPAVPARAGVISNLLGTAAETVQPGSSGVVRSGWGLLRGVGRAVIPRRRRHRPAPPPTASSQKTRPPRSVPSAASPPEDTEGLSREPKVLADSPPRRAPQTMATDPQPYGPSVAQHEQLTVEDLLVAPPPPPGAEGP